MSAQVISLEDFQQSAKELEALCQQELMTGSRWIPVSVKVIWSESNLFQDDEELNFSDFEKKAFDAAVSNLSGGYDKTKIIVSLQKEGSDLVEPYECRLDLAPHDEIGFEDHILQMISFSETDKGVEYYGKNDELISFIKLIKFNNPKLIVERREAAEQARKEMLLQQEQERLREEEERAQAEAQAKAAMLLEIERLKNAVEFQHLEQIGEYQPTASVAKNIRRDLKKHFPKIKFSVRKRYYDDISVSWENGPTKDQVKDIIGKYKNKFLDDSLDFSNYSPSAWNKVFGGVGSMFLDREVGDNLVSVAINIINSRMGTNISMDAYHQNDAVIVGGVRLSELVWETANRISTNGKDWFHDEEKITSIS